ncbi:SET and MYND domain-containing protein 4 [Pieris rapae]|uniref:SET and MYND domain-containing protein 4 n=1 Tax=Pieris rapae TaxID=64459 RepID=UPI001E27C1ED|nr:SET and MYND domain-containing protein 4 [Pieris rapae]
MFLQPRLFNEFLAKSGFDTQVYDAMESDDLADVVIVALNILKKTNNLPDMPKLMKSEALSNTLREAGNKYLPTKQYNSSLHCYNKALACAPYNSKAMALAYSNRSFIMFLLKRFQNCITDIDRCFSSGCPDYIKQKLLKRREDANKFSVMDSLSLNTLKVFTNNFFNFNAVCHTDVPFVSKDINIEVEFSQPKITAANFINSGTIIAVEEAYMTGLLADNQFNTCYNCLSITPNLIPCSTCCSALFCSEKCKQNCNEQYHKYECDIVNVIEKFCNGGGPNLMIKSVLKLKTKLKWNEFIKESKSMGNSRIVKSTIREVFNSASECSLLTFPENRTFVHGIMYNASFLCAALLHYVFKIPRFMPTSNKDEALRALARVMMYLCVFGSPSYVTQAVTDLVSDRTIPQKHANFAWYIFYSKLKHECKPNVIVSWINNKAVLIAVKKIMPGEEITTSCIEPTFKMSEHDVNIDLLVGKGQVCTCIKCTKKDSKNDTLSSAQTEFIKKIGFNVLHSNVDVWHINKVSEKCKEIMNVLTDVPHSKEYLCALTQFRKCLILCEALETQNFCIL